MSLTNNSKEIRMEKEKIITKEMELILQDEFLKNIVDEFDVIAFWETSNTIHFHGKFNRDLIKKISEHYEIYWKITEKGCVQGCGTHWKITEEGYVEGLVNLKIEQYKQGDGKEQQEKKCVAIKLEFLFS